MVKKIFSHKAAEKTVNACFSQQQAKAMYQLLNEIHSGLKDKNKNKNFMQMPFIEMAWMTGIENCLRKNTLKKFSSAKKQDLKTRKQPKKDFNNCCLFEIFVCTLQPVVMIFGSV